MIHHKLESGDEYSVGKSSNPKKVLIQITDNRNEEQARSIFTKEEVRELIRKLDKLSAIEIEFNEDIHVPGMYKCPICKFVLIENVINANTGDVGVNMKKAKLKNICANNCTVMDFYTWKELSNSKEETIKDLLDKLDNLDNKVKMLENK